MTKGSLRKYAEVDNPEEFEKLQQLYNTFRKTIQNFMPIDPFEDDETDDNIIIDQRYLLDNEKKLNDNTKIVNTVNHFFTND